MVRRSIRASHRNYIETTNAGGSWKKKGDWRKLVYTNICLQSTGLQSNLKRLNLNSILAILFIIY